MKLEVDGVTFDIKWHYDGVGEGKRYRKVTFCSVMARGKAPGTVASFLGSVRFNPKDGVYVKERGRKLALARAIEVLPRATRTLLWDAYWRALDNWERSTPLRYPPLTGGFIEEGDHTDASR